MACQDLSKPGSGVLADLPSNISKDNGSEGTEGGLRLLPIQSLQRPSESG
jgi:hypothetical protein